MADPVLTREVEVPRPRPQGAALVAVTFLALFSALGASAFVIRVRSMQSPSAARDVEPSAGPIAPVVALAPAGGDIVPVTLMSPEETKAATERALDEASRAAVAEFRQLAAKDGELALERFGALSPAVQQVLAKERRALADDWAATQLSRLARELERHDCGAVDERLARMHRLLPDRPVPRGLEGCPTK
jgi:hypothetical protein